jgi:exopolysaccharide biosynthesis polyprenyl glycosylphosphotransferase
MVSEGSRVAKAHWQGLTPRERYRHSIGDSDPDSGAVAFRGDIMGSFRVRLIISDSVVIAAVLGFGLFISSRATTWAIDPTLAIYGTPILIGLVWLAFLAMRGSYDQRIVGLGTEEIRRVVSATLYTFAIVAGTSYLIRADISRAYAFVSLPLGLVLITAMRFYWRGWLYRQRSKGRFTFRTVVVGDNVSRTELAQRLERDSFTGYLVVGEFGEPVQGGETESQWFDDLLRLLDQSQAAAVALAPSAEISSETIRQLAWLIEARGIELLVAPAIMDVAGPRLTVRPAAGLPLLHLDQARLSRPQRISKRSLDLVGSITLIALLSPLMLITALSVRLTSTGPVIYRQIRIGRGGREFTMLKFRTMKVGANAEREQLRAQHGIATPMFKLTKDPRITKAGRFLRRWSLDELPQLFNVVGGSMSLVGPRPHPLDDVNRYEFTAYRRLALKPGMTGLWQVEGRSDLDWSEALQLDIYYVETWSLAGDLVLLSRTLRAVLRGSGAR